MFGQLPKLFDRSFFIGFFLPSSLLVAGIVATLCAFDYVYSDFRQLIAEKSTFGAAFSIVIIWFFSILLMALNRPFIRLLEGYGRGNPFNIFLRSRKKEFQKHIYPLLDKMKKIIEARQSGGILTEPDQEDDFRSKLWKAVNSYPEIVDNVLPTKLGNVMRAYERYSDVVYGIEAIVLWPRLFMVIPEDARNRIREGEALFQFALNALIGGSVSFVFYIVMVLVSVRSGNSTNLFSALHHWPFIPVLSALLGWFGWWQLPDAASERGEQIKAVFDLYRGALAQGLGLRTPPYARSRT